MRYSLRHALSLDSVDGCTHNPMITTSAIFLQSEPRSRPVATRGSTQCHDKLTIDMSDESRDDLVTFS